MFPKCFISLLILCTVHKTLSKPTEDLTEGRGVGSTVWGWITYPFSWWSTSESDQPSLNDDIEVTKRNVTVWCNDQTCTTMKCDKYGCKNTTCNIYDTDFKGECREYNTGVKPEEPATPKPSEIVTNKPSTDKVTEPSKRPESPTPPTKPIAPTTSTTTELSSNQSTEEHPLDLEVMLSSTVTEKNSEEAPLGTKDKTSSAKNKI